VSVSCAAVRPWVRCLVHRRRSADAKLVPPAGEPPFGPISNCSNDEPETFFPSLFDRMEREIDDVIERLCD
jgi:hypothetical protein